MIVRAIKFIAPKSLFALGLFVALAASAASARAQTAGAAVFSVPFEFTAGDVRLPAGEYTVGRTSQAGLAYVVRSRDGRSAATFTTESALHALAGGRPLQLTFYVYEGRYYLYEVWAAADGTGAQLRAPRAVREVSKKSSGEGRVTVIARNR